MTFKVVLFTALLSIARAGVPIGYASQAVQHVGYAGPAVHQAYSDATAVSYSSISNPVAHTYAAPAVAKVAAVPSIAYSSYAAPAVAKVAAVPQVSYSSYSSPAVSYGAPAVSYGAPSHVAYAAPIAKVAYAAPVAKTIIEDHSAPAQYDFGYAVNDPHTGDSKTQHESRQGDVVHGSYSLIEADGSKRIVEYQADPHNGFNAVVHKEPGAVHVKTVAPVAKYAAPVAYASPAVAAYSAPAYAKFAAPAVAQYAAAPAVTKYVASSGYYH